MILARRKFPSLSQIPVNPESWLLVTSAGSAIIGMTMTLSFWTVQLRYTDDFMPSLLIFATANVARQYNTLELEKEDRWQRVFVILIILLSGITIVASTLVALKSDSLSFLVNLIDGVLRILNLK